MTTHVKHQVNDLWTGTWRLDPAQTTITVTAKKLGFFTVPATLAVSSGTIEIDADHEVVSVEVVADANSYTSANPKRNDHIRSADFLDADNHPQLTFRAGSVTGTAKGYHTDGSVTVKGQTFPLELDINNVEAGPRNGSFQATAIIDRNAIGVDKLPSFIIGRDLHLTVNATVELVDV
ncbi:MAG: YceI family protein [Acidimicrobiales bacterium]|nr:YceI family protein [Acidimicrobiales bacterium]